jgi:hypothetical protein
MSDKKAHAHDYLLSTLSSSLYDALSVLLIEFLSTKFGEATCEFLLRETIQILALDSKFGLNAKFAIERTKSAD